MKVPISVELETIGETALRHFENGILDGLKFALNLLILRWEVTKRTKHLQSVIISTLKNKPARRFR